ncbi:hypothetical protein IC220_01630 [Wolbachia endosymbiont of Pentalonia nigronervosa]|uniref:hypothetical protein n=1 Tax=Wolbachia endosymbiont of Pentalonia nigronervosa TaxID=1301914 RepID=UPI00165F9356|nr:hypothetical protein [Wolbachia endosymbiont of Pentalonia nigronervosa]MBD0391161.1 hypothetical protein [Wolbachia endosymbiont of Pentalonia nigronervosa]
MSDEDLFKENDNIEENNDDDIREKYLKNSSLQEQYKEEDEQYIQKYIEDHFKDFEDIFTQINEGIDKLDSYERTMQVKRSIDRLIETLYSQAASEDINVELETTKHTCDKSNSIKRIQEKRRKQTIEETLSHIFTQQQELTNTKHKTEDIHEIKMQVKSSIKDVLFSVIANRMDPKKRAGETADSNEKQAHIYGRTPAGGVLGALLKTFLVAVNAVIHEVAKSLKHTDKHETSFTKQVEESRNTESHKGRSI